MIPFTPPPTLPANLPDLPNGFTWKLIQETQIGFPIRDGWFFTEESIEAGTSYHVAKEQTGEVGVFSNGLTVEVLEANNAIKAIDEAKYSVDIAINALITKKIIDKQQYSEGNIASFQAIVEQEYVNLPINDPNRRRTIFIKTIANTETNILYRIRFESPSTLWDEEWQTGQIMTQVVLLTQ